MGAIVFGSRGLIGAGLCRQLEQLAIPHRGATRPEFDLEYPTEWADFTASLVFLCAGINGFAECEGNRLSWRVNADGPVALGGAFLRRGAFVVYVSSGAVEWAGHTAYGRQRQHAEIGLTAIGAERLAIVRPEKVTSVTALAFGRRLAEIGTARQPGIVRWQA